MNNMKKLNITLATMVLTVILTVLLSSCHRNTCPTFGQTNDTCTEVNS